MAWIQILKNKTKTKKSVKTANHWHHRSIIRHLAYLAKTKTKNEEKMNSMMQGEKEDYQHATQRNCMFTKRQSFSGQTKHLVVEHSSAAQVFTWTATYRRGQMRFTNKSHPIASYTTQTLLRSSYCIFGEHVGFLGHCRLLHKSRFGFGWHRRRMGKRGGVSVPLRNLLWRNSSQVVVLLPKLTQTQSLILQLTQFEYLHLRSGKINGRLSTVKTDDALFIQVHRTDSKFIHVELEINLCSSFWLCVHAFAFSLCKILFASNSLIAKVVWECLML